MLRSDACFITKKSLLLQTTPHIFSTQGRVSKMAVSPAANAVSMIIKTLDEDAEYQPVVGKPKWG